MKPLIAIVAVLAAAALTVTFWPATSTPSSGAATVLPAASTALTEVTLPATLSPAAQRGKQAFENNCASCHGANAAGQDGVAPPLIHKIYEPSHHGDESFQRAAAKGVRAHHWPYGDMPPVVGISRDDVATIIGYIRELQRANGIN